MKDMIHVQPLLEKKYDREYSVEVDVSSPYASYIEFLRIKNRKVKSIADMILISSGKKNLTFSDMKTLSPNHLEKIFTREDAYKIFLKMNKKFNNHGPHLFDSFYDFHSPNPEKRAFRKNFAIDEQFHKFILVTAWSHFEYIRDHRHFPFILDNEVKIKFTHYHSGINMFLYLPDMEKTKSLLQYFLLYKDYFYSNITDSFSFRLRKKAWVYKKIKLYLPLLHYFKFSKVPSAYNFVIKEPTVYITYKKNGWTFDKKKIALGHFDLDNEKEVEKIIMQNLFKIRHDCERRVKLLLPPTGKDWKHFHRQINEIGKWFKERNISTSFIVQWG